ncbi:MAG: LSM domain-containing protein [Thermofilaceae archaeon]
MSAKSPLDLLERLKERNTEVYVKLKDSSEYKGVIEDFDRSMNIILGEAMQVNEDGTPLVKYGRIFIRGSNVVYIFTREVGITL